MKNRILTPILLFGCLAVMLGCARTQLSVDRAQDVMNQEDLLQILGKPNSVKHLQDGSEEWTYRSKSLNIFKLEYDYYEFIYVLTKDGRVIQKNISETKYKRRLIPLSKLPAGFEEFE